MTGHFYIGICFPLYNVLSHIWVTVTKKSAGGPLCSWAHCNQFMNDSLGGWGRRGGWLNTNSILPALWQRLRLLYAQTWYAFTAATGAGIRNCSELRPFKHAFVQLKGPEGGYASKFPLEMLVTTWCTLTYLNDGKAKFSMLWTKYIIQEHRPFFLWMISEFDHAWIHNLPVIS